MPEKSVYINGEYVAWEKATVHLMSQSFGRGTAMFDILSAHQTPSGTALFRLDEHVNRFFRTAEQVDIKIPCTKKELHQKVLETVRRNGMSQGLIKIIGYFGQPAVDIKSTQAECDLAILVIDSTSELYNKEPFFENGTTVCLSKWRKLDPQTVPVEAKVAANYLNGFMSRQDAASRGFEIGLMLDTQGFIAEGGIESVFLVKDGRLLAPVLGTILQSISRKTVLEVAEANGIEVIQARLKPQLLFEAEEIFLSGTGNKVWPVRQFEDRALNPCPGVLARKLNELIENIFSGRDERFGHWLFYPEGKR